MLPIRFTKMQVPVMNALSNSRRIGLICLVLAIGTLALYWRLFHSEFINYEDPEHITGNSLVQHGLNGAGILSAFRSTDTGNWYPLTWLSHIVDFHLFGFNAAGHHATNLLLHIANVLLLFLLLRRMTGTTWPSAFVAALFAWHPLHVESVAWISQRADLLGTFFCLFSLWTYVRYAEKPATNLYLLTLFLFALGLMSSPMLISLPFLLLLLDLWPLHRLSPALTTLTEQVPPPSLTRPLGKLALEKIPFILLAAISVALTLWAQQSSGSPNALNQFTLPFRLVSTLVACVAYIGKMFWPTNLTVFYSTPSVIPAWQIAGAALLLVVSSVAVIRARRKFPFLMVGWFWFLIALIPTIGLMPIQIQSMADRFTYIPLIGLFIMLAWSITRLRNQTVLGLLTAIPLVACLIVTSRQLPYWHDSVALFTHATELTRDNPIAHKNLADALVDGGNTESAQKHYEEAIRLDPRYAAAHFNLGNLFNALGKMDPAIEHLSTAVKLTPKLPELHNNLGLALARKGQLKEALPEFFEALRIKPDYAKAHYNLGVAYGMMDEPKEALPHYQDAVRLAPDDADARKNLGNILLKQNKLPEAAEQYLQVVRLRPDDLKTRSNLARALMPTKPEAAIQQLYEILRREPDMLITLNDLASILSTHPKTELHNPSEAVRLAEHACELTGRTNAAFLGTLETAYAEAGRFPDAIITAKKIREQLSATEQKDEITALEKRMALYQSGKSGRAQ
ncbi:MAG: Tetratricopeptide 2 repeat protein [Pedosphaera sp.]|nr:Tetratricopeptide 2 repeat protein [Pedosphaera sp.]